MAAHRAPKQWVLSKIENITSFENWRHNLVYTLSLDQSFAPYLEATWQKKSATNPTRGLQDDVGPIPAADRKTAVQKNVTLELMLGMVATYCPVISAGSIVTSSTSLANIWQKIRQHFGFQSTGAHFLDLASIKLEQDEKPEDLFQRIMAFLEDNLLTTTGGITHHGEVPTTNEDLSATLENTAVVIWLQLLNPALPQLVKQKFGSELRNKTLSSLKPEISQALTSLLDELNNIEESKAFRSATHTGPPYCEHDQDNDIVAARSRTFQPARGNSTKYQSASSRNMYKGQKSSRNTYRGPSNECKLCKAEKRPYAGHTLATCYYLSSSERKDLIKSFRIEVDDVEHMTESVSNISVETDDQE